MEFYRTCSICKMIFHEDSDKLIECQESKNTSMCQECYNLLKKDEIKIKEKDKCSICNDYHEYINKKICNPCFYYYFFLIKLNSDKLDKEKLQ